MTKRVAIKLLKPWHGFRIGHTLSLVPEPVAQVLIAQGRAELEQPISEPEPIKRKRKRKKKSDEISKQATDKPATDNP